MPETTRRPVAIEGVLAECVRLVDAALDGYLPSDDAPPANVHRAMRYSVFAGGKRLRPILLIEGAAVAGAPADAVLPAAGAVELIHTYSLIHDDLPAMDNAPLRRGRPACHVVFGEAMAVLAGDALHAEAFALMAKQAGLIPGEPARVVRAIRALTAAIGSEGMVGGQALDLRAAPTVPGRTGATEEAVREIHSRKTGALIRASLRIGAILGGADEADLTALDRYGGHLGVGFQILDDILDVIGERGKLGKNTGADAGGSKVTFPSVVGLERSRRLAADATRDAIAALAPLGRRGARLQDLAVYLLERDR
jgi:geranylgeranyl pyrophosphate synthase